MWRFQLTRGSKEINDGFNLRNDLFDDGSTLEWCSWGGFSHERTDIVDLSPLRSKSLVRVGRSQAFRPPIGEKGDTLSSLKLFKPSPSMNS